MDIRESSGESANRHPWELSRSDSILKMMNKFEFLHHDWVYADIGAGDLYFSRILGALTTNPVYAVDPHFELIEAAGDITCSHTCDSIRTDSVDCALLLDVLEHIEDEMSVLQESGRILKTGSPVIITVPAFQALYATHDSFLGHYRRYSISSLTSIVRDAGFEVLNSHYFYTTLLPFRAATKLYEKLFPNTINSRGVGSWRYSKSSMITTVIRTMLNTDYLVHNYLNNINIKIPGLSICLIARKK